MDTSSRTIGWENFLLWKYLFFKWRYQLVALKKVALSLGMAAFTGLLAQIYIPLPFTPVPITGQVLGVLMSGVICGGVYGSLSQLMYVSLGLVGVPWFAGGKSASFAILTGPTGGYLIGFILAPLLVGRFTDKYISSRRFFPQLLLMMGGVGIIYFCGAVVFALVMKAGLWRTMFQAVIPFLPGDLFKAALSAGISASFLPRAPYNGEVDKMKFEGRRY